MVSNSDCKALPYGPVPSWLNIQMCATYLQNPGPVQPFVGAGVGVVHTRIGKTTMAFPATTTTVPGGSRTGLAWMMTAGLARACF